MARAPIMVTVTRGALSAADAYAQEQIASLHEGAVFNARLSRMTQKGKEEREGLRGLWWAGCQLLSENVEHKLWDTQRKASNQILQGLGFVRPRGRADGTFDIIPVSLADNAMDDEEFAILLERARAFCIDRWGFDPFQAWTDQKDAEQNRSG